ncbi:MAG: hypothetical protein AAB585_01795 [Patescibacteria group bacterium]
MLKDREVKLIGLVGLLLGLVLLGNYLVFSFPYIKAIITGDWLEPPIGFLENVDGVSGVAGGWALDPDTPAQAIDVHFYLDGPAGQGGIFIGFVKAGLPRPDVNRVTGHAGNHGFRFTVPDQYRDGREHTIYAYGIDVGVSYNPPLGNSPLIAELLLPAGSLDSNPEPARRPGFVLVGQPEKVFAYSQDRCETLDIPDAPARTFRNADGLINLIDSHYVSYRSTGSSFANLRRDCAKIMDSAKNPDFNQFTYYEWLTAPYTLDGATVYNLVHNEWYAYLIDPRCSRASPGDGWVNAITLVQSKDGGANYTRPTDYLVWKPSTPWDNSFSCTANNYTRYGAFNPSNIVKKDNYYYALYQSERDPTGRYDWGTCLMRTARLDSASAWMVWTAGGWDNAPDAACQLIARDKIEKMHESLTYNTYFDAYLLVGTKYSPEEGVYFSLSKDLFNWSEPIKLYGRQAVYPSVIDHTDTSRNFENSGREVYLYFTQNNGGLNRDLLRQKIRFTGGVPAVSQTPSLTPEPTFSASPTPILPPTATPTPVPTPTLTASPTPTPSLRLCRWYNFFGFKDLFCRRLP